MKELVKYSLMDSVQQTVVHTTTELPKRDVTEEKMQLTDLVVDMAFDQKTELIKKSWTLINVVVRETVKTVVVGEAYDKLKKQADKLARESITLKNSNYDHFFKHTTIHEEVAKVVVYFFTEQLLTHMVNEGANYTFKGVLPNLIKEIIQTPDFFKNTGYVNAKYACRRKVKNTGKSHELAYSS